MILVSGGAGLRFGTAMKRIGTAAFLYETTDYYYE